MRKNLLVLAVTLALTPTLYAEEGEKENKDKQSKESEQLETVNVESILATPTPIEDFIEIERETATDLKDVLIDQTSVDFGAGTGTAQWISIRGLSESQIELVVDDTSTSAHMFHHQSRFSLDPALVKIIEIEKGAGAASSGLGVTGGRIVAETLDAGDLLEDGESTGARINAGVSSNKGHNAGIALYGRSGRFDAIVIANGDIDKIYKDGNGEKVKYSAIDKRSLMIKGGFNIDDNNRLELRHTHEDIEGVRALRDEMANIIRDNGENGDSPRYRDIAKDNTNFSYEGRNLGALGDIDANVFYINNAQAEGKPIAGGPAALSDVYSKAIGGNVGLSTPIGEHKVLYGVNLRKEINGADTGPYGNQNKVDTGLYAEGIWDFDYVTLTTGVRYDHFEITNAKGQSFSNHNVNPSIGVIWEATDGLSLKANYNIASRSPKLLDAYYYALEFTRERANFTASDDFKAETSHNAEIGFNWEKNNISLEGAVFYQTINDLHNFNYRENVFFNKGTLKNKGYELSASYAQDGFTARAGVSHAKPTLDGTTYDNIEVAVPAGRQWKTSLSYQFDNPSLELGWRGRFAERSEHQNGRRGSTVTRKGYGVHDIYLNWQPTGKDNFNVNFAINNVGNKFYQSHTGRAREISLPETGRNYRLNFNYKF